MMLTKRRIEVLSVACGLRIAAMLAGAGLPAAVWAVPGADNGAKEMPANPMAASSLAQLLLGLLLVLALIGVSAWLLRRFNRYQSAAGRDLRILGGLSMGTRERVVLIQVGKQQLLLGVAPGRVQTLHVLADPVSEDIGSNTGGGFAERLQSVMRRGGPA